MSAETKQEWMYFLLGAVGGALLFAATGCSTVGDVLEIIAPPARRSRKGP